MAFVPFYEYRFTEYEYEEDRDALMTERITNSVHQVAGVDERLEQVCRQLWCNILFVLHTELFPGSVPA
jgi:hypothetical protein